MIFWGGDLWYWRMIRALWSKGWMEIREYILRDLQVNMGMMKKITKNF
jgi:hypothetical protein